MPTNLAYAFQAVTDAPHWTTIAAFWASVVLVGIAVTATTINYIILRSQLDPHVIVHATGDERRPSLIILVIENIGKRIARDITFLANAQIPARAFGFEDAPVPEPMTTGPLVTGIKALAPGDRRVITWGQYHGLMKGLREGQITITARYRSAPVLFLHEEWHETECPIDVRSFAATDASDSNWDRKAAENLKDIARHLQRLVEGRAELHVRVVAAQDDASD